MLSCSVCHVYVWIIWKNNNNVDNYVYYTKSGYEEKVQDQARTCDLQEQSHDLSTWRKPSFEYRTLRLVS